MQVKKALIAGLVAFLSSNLEVYGTAKNYSIQGQQPAAASSGVIYRAFEAINNMQIANTSCSEERGSKECILLADKKVDGANLTYGIGTVSHPGSSNIFFSNVLYVLVYRHHEQKHQFFLYSTADQFDTNAFPSIINLDVDEKILNKLRQKDKTHYMRNPSRDYTPKEKENAHRDIVRTLEEILNGANWIFR